jgi:hypothetical protein
VAAIVLKNSTLIKGRVPFNKSFCCFSYPFRVTLVDTVSASNSRTVVSIEESYPPDFCYKFANVCINRRKQSSGGNDDDVTDVRSRRSSM